MMQNQIRKNQRTRYKTATTLLGARQEHMHRARDVGGLMSARQPSILRHFPVRLLATASLVFFPGPGVGAQAAIPIVDVREEVRIESNDSVPGMLLTGIERLAVLPDGRMLTTHPREAVVRVFDPGGRLLKVVGRRGDGPGEFRRIRQVGFVGDRIWVEDQGWYQLFDARTYEPVGRVARGPTSGAFHGLASDSTSLFSLGRHDSTGVSIHDRSGQRRMSIDIARRAAGHSFEVPWTEISPAGFLTGRIVPRTLYSPLRTATGLSLVPGGREAVVLEPSELWKGPPGQFTIRRIETATGRISAPVTVSLAVRRVTRAEADSLVRHSTPPVTDPRDAKGAAEYRAKAKVPATFPAYRTFTPSADGVLWLTEYARPDMSLVVDFTGKPLMRVRLPKGMRVVAVSRTHVWGVAFDADDLPIVSRYRVQR
jgi:hypothetical protein